MTDFPSCSKRQELVEYQRTGEKLPISRCMEKTAEAFNMNVTAEVCTACPIRQAIEERIKAKAAPTPRLEELLNVRQVIPDPEPTPKKRSAESPWLPCIDRQRLTIIKCCGSFQYIRRCVCPESSQNGLEVVPEICKGCGVRRPPASNSVEPPQ